MLSTIADRQQDPLPICKRWRKEVEHTGGSPNAYKNNAGGGIRGSEFSMNATPALQNGPTHGTNRLRTPSGKVTVKFFEQDEGNPLRDYGADGGQL